MLQRAAMSSLIQQAYGQQQLQQQQQPDASTISSEDKLRRVGCQRFRSAMNELSRQVCAVLL